MKRRIKYALTVHWLTDGRRFSKTDRQHLLTKCKKRSMRRFIQRDAKQEISEELKEKIYDGLKWMYESEEREAEEMKKQYLGKQQ
jgi:hypothetical protein